MRPQRPREPPSPASGADLRAARDYPPVSRSARLQNRALRIRARAPQPRQTIPARPRDPAQRFPSPSSRPARPADRWRPLRNRSPSRSERRNHRLSAPTSDRSSRDSVRRRRWTTPAQPRGPLQRLRNPSRRRPKNPGDRSPPRNRSQPVSAPRHSRPNPLCLQLFRFDSAAAAGPAVAEADAVRWAGPACSPNPPARARTAERRQALPNSRVRSIRTSWTPGSPPRRSAQALRHR